MKNRKLIIIISIVLTLVCIISVVGFVLNKKFSKEDNSQMEQASELETIFTPTEEYLANKIKTEFEKQNYIDSKNINKFEITKFQQYGYFKFEPNMRYIYVYYEYECQDGTTNCVNVPYSYVPDYNRFTIVIDLNDQNYLQFRSGFSTTIDQHDDLVQDYTMPEYYNLKS